MFSTEGYFVEKTQAHSIFSYMHAYTQDTSHLNS